MYSYQKLVNKLTSILDNDTKGIIEKMSVFYIEDDYKKITKYLKNKINKNRYGLFDFVCLNNFHHYIFKACNKELSNINYLETEITLDDINKLIKKKIKEQVKCNSEITFFINNLYYDPPYYFPSPIENTFAESREYIIGNLKPLNMTQEELEEYLRYLSTNVDTVLDDISEFYDEYKEMFMEYVELI